MKPLNLVAISIAMVAVACAKKRPTESGAFHYRFSVTAIVNSAQPRVQAAEELAEDAERLFDARAFDQARTVAQTALTVDPNNLRAGLLDVFLDALIRQKGMLARVQPLAARSPVLARQWREEFEDTRSKAERRLNWYYLDGKPDIADEKSLQAVIDGQIDALERFRLYVAAHLDSEITINVSPLLISDGNQRYAARCVVTEANGTYDLTCPSATERTEVKLNRADFEMLQSGLVFYELMLGFGNSYDMTGSIATLSTVGQILPRDHQRLVADLMSRAEFGGLRVPNTLTKARGWALQLVGGLDWALNNPQLACAQGEEDRANRPGFFFNQGFCYAAELKSYVPKAREIVGTRGAVTLDYVVNDGSQLPFRENFFAPYEAPIPSLKRLGPLTFDRCGKLIDAGDVTLGGLFPDGDAKKYLTETQACPN